MISELKRAHCEMCHRSYESGFWKLTLCLWLRSCGSSLLLEKIIFWKIRWQQPQIWQNSFSESHISHRQVKQKPDRKVRRWDSLHLLLYPTTFLKLVFSHCAMGSRIHSDSENMYSFSLWKLDSVCPHYRVTDTTGRRKGQLLLAKISLNVSVHCSCGVGGSELPSCNALNKLNKYNGLCIPFQLPPPN